jgi:hypothetical protein
VAELALPALQRWFLEVVTHPDGVAAGAAAAEGPAPEDIVLPSRALDAEARLGIYAEAYFLRLLEVLEEDFPGLVALLGPERARALFRDYVAACPSQHQNLNQLGKRLPDFLSEGGGDVPGRLFAVDLARLERAIQDVFDAPRAPVLEAEDVLGRAPEEYAELVLALAPHAHLLTLEHPANTWYQSFRDGDLREAPAPARAHLLLYRRDFRVWRLGLEAAQHRLLELLAAGEPLGLALGSLALEFDGGAFAEQVGGWFRDWAAMGLFARPADRPA